MDQRGAVISYKAMACLGRFSELSGASGNASAFPCGEKGCGRKEEEQVPAPCENECRVKKIQKDLVVVYRLLRGDSWIG